MIQQGAAKTVEYVPRPVPLERRASVRHVCSVEAVSRPLESPDALCWGARVKDISAGGVSLMLCYPFKPGASLAVDLHAQSRVGTLLVKVVHVSEQDDGTWLLGCEFAAPLSDTELKALL
jgi:hypothetical protein